MAEKKDKPKCITYDVNGNIIPPKEPPPKKTKPKKRPKPRKSRAKPKRVGRPPKATTAPSATAKPVVEEKVDTREEVLNALELSDEEKEHAKKDMGSMLDYIDKLNELDTTGIEPMSHVFKVQNVFREDVVTNGDESEKTLKNAPGEKDNMFMVPKTFD